MIYGSRDIRKSRKERIRRKVLKKRVREFQATREYENISALITKTKKAERENIVKLLDNLVDHSRVDCGLECVAHKQIQFIKDLKD